VTGLVEAWWRSAAQPPITIDLTQYGGPSASDRKGTIMTAHYHSPDDLQQLAEFKELAPQEFQAFAKLDGTIGREGGAIDQLNRELIAVGVAISSQCPYYIQVHVTHAKKAGATKAQIAEAAMVAAGLGAGAAVTHGTMAFRIFDEA
jgi:AhpD family alkylhydroperoxidase